MRALDILPEIGVILLDSAITDRSLDQNEIESISWLIAGETFASLGLIPGASMSLQALGVTDEEGTLTIQVVPVPAAVWLLGGGLIALVGLRRRFKN